MREIPYFVMLSFNTTLQYLYNSLSQAFVFINQTILLLHTIVENSAKGKENVAFHNQFEYIIFHDYRSPSSLCCLITVTLYKKYNNIS